MSNNNYQHGYSLIAMLVSTTIGIITCSCALHYLYMVVNIYNKIQLKFNQQNTRLMIRNFIGDDLYTITKSVHTCRAAEQICNHLIPPSIKNLISQRQIKPLSNILILSTANGDIIYYLRKSTLTKHSKQNSYALYRDDIAHNAIALAEEVHDLSAQIIDLNTYNYKVSVNIIFSNNSKPMELECILQH